MMPNDTGVTKLVSGIEVTRVPLESISAAWPCVEELVDSALNEMMGEFSSFDVLQLLRKEVAQLWLCIDADKRILGIGITELIRTPQRSVCNFWLAAGQNLEVWQEAVLVVEEWAAFNGCDLLKAQGRRGWSRYARRHGFTSTHETYYKSLTRNQQ